MSDLKSADEIIEEYSKPHSMIDNGNLYFACCTYQTEYKKLQAELAQLKEKCEQWEKAYLEKQDQFVNETKRASDLYEKCAEYEKVLKSIDTDTEIDEQGREWRMDKDDMRIISRNVLEKWKGKG